MRLIRRLLERAGTAASGLDPRTKVLLLVCISVATLVARGWPKLAILLALALTWTVLASVRTTQRRPRLFVWAATAASAVGLALWAGDVPVGPFVAPVVRMVVLLLAGWAFSRSTPAGELACALQKVRCPKPLVLIVVAARSLLGLLASEVRLAHEGMRIRAGCLSPSRAPWKRLKALRRVSVAFSARLLLRSDQMAAAAESRGFSRPGARSSLRAIRLRLADLATGVACCGATALLCLL